MIRLIALSLLATALVPAAAAECVGDVCATLISSGDGCTQGASWDDATRGVDVAAGERHVFVTNGCYVYNDGGYSEDGSNVAAGYYACCENGYQTAGVSWYGYTWNEENHHCRYSAYTYGLDPIPGGSPVEPIECVSGQPGLLVP